MLFNAALCHIEKVRTSTSLLEPWMLLVFLLIAAAHAWIRMNYPRRINKLFRSFLNVRLMRQTMREELSLSHRGSMLLSLTFVLIIALAVYEIIAMWIPNKWPQGLSFYLVIAGIILLLYLLKFAGIWFIQNITEGDYQLNEYKFSVFLHNKLLGIIAIPLVILLTTTPLFYYDGEQIQRSFWAEILVTSTAFTVVLTYLIRIIRGIIAAWQIKLPTVYIIFYLCTLEFLPIALFVKYLNI